MMRALALHGLSYAIRSRGDVGGFAGLGVTLYRRATSLLARLAVGGMLAVIAAILIGAVATSNWLAQLLVTGLAAFALWIPAFLLVSRYAEWRRRRQRRASVRQAARPPLASEPLGATDRLDAAWTGLTLEAGSRASEVRRLEQQLAAIWRALPATSLDPRVHELQLLIGKRIPQLIDSQLACLPLRRAERSAAVGELVDLVAEFTDDSLRRHGELATSGREQHAVLRRRIEDHLDRNGFRPLA